MDARQRCRQLPDLPRRVRSQGQKWQGLGLLACFLGLAEGKSVATGALRLSPAATRADTATAVLEPFQQRPGFLQCPLNSEGDSEVPLASSTGGYQVEKVKRGAGQEVEAVGAVRATDETEVCQAAQAFRGGLAEDRQRSQRGRRAGAVGSPAGQGGRQPWVRGTSRGNGRRRRGLGRSDEGGQGRAAPGKLPQDRVAGDDQDGGTEGLIWCSECSCLHSYNRVGSSALASCGRALQGMAPPAGHGPPPGLPPQQPNMDTVPTDPYLASPCGAYQKHRHTKSPRVNPYEAGKTPGMDTMG